MTTGLSPWHLRSWNPVKDWCWPTWRTSQTPCLTPCSLPTGHTGQWMMQPTWDCTTSCNTSILQGHMRILFANFSLAFNTIIPDILHSKITKVTVPGPTCQWITNFLTDRWQQVRLENITSSTWTHAPGMCTLLTAILPLYQRLHLAWLANGHFICYWSLVLFIYIHIYYIFIYTPSFSHLHKLFRLCCYPCS